MRSRACASEAGVPSPSSSPSLPGCGGGAVGSRRSISTLLRPSHSSTEERASGETAIVSANAAAIAASA